MARKKNREFRNNPEAFLRDHFINRSPDDPNPIPAGVAGIDLTPILGPVARGRKTVKIEDFYHTHPNLNTPLQKQRIDRRPDGLGPRPVKAYWLPAIHNDAESIVLGNQAKYMFTCDLTGCMFAAYGADRNNLSVEHVNEYDDWAVVEIVPRARQIIANNYGFFKILASRDIVPCPPNARAHVIRYPTHAWVIGVRGDRGAYAGWHFYFKLAEDPLRVLRL